MRVQQTTTPQMTPDDEAAQRVVQLAVAEAIERDRAFLRIKKKPGRSCFRHLSHTPIQPRPGPSSPFPRQNPPSAIGTTPRS